MLFFSVGGSVHAVIACADAVIATLKVVSPLSALLAASAKACDAIIGPDQHANATSSFGTEGLPT